VTKSLPDSFQTPLISQLVPGRGWCITNPLLAFDLSLLARAPPSRIRLLPKALRLNRTPKTRSYQSSNTSREPGTAAFSRRRAMAYSKKRLQALSFQDFTRNSHGLKILPAIPKTEPLFSRFYGYPGGEGGTSHHPPLALRQITERKAMSQTPGAAFW